MTLRIIFSGKCQECAINNKYCLKKLHFGTILLNFSLYAQKLDQNL